MSGVTEDVEYYAFGGEAGPPAHVVGAGSDTSAVLFGLGSYVLTWVLTAFLAMLIRLLQVDHKQEPGAAPCTVQSISCVCQKERGLTQRNL